MNVESLHIYPIKSLAGISLEKATVTMRGLEYDRRFMLVKPDGGFITQRTHPQLTQFGVEVLGETLRITHADMGYVHATLHPALEANRQATVWDDTVRVSSGSSEVDEFFSSALGEPIQMVGMPDSTERQIELDYSRPGEWVSFADGYPILVLGRASMAELNSRMERPVPTDRFRANIIVSGAEAWQEDTWTTLTGGPVSMKLVKQCARCIVIRTDQQTGDRMDEPMKTLLTYRRIDNKVMVGMNAIPKSDSEGRVLSVGDSVYAQ